MCFMNTVNSYEKKDTIHNWTLIQGIAFTSFLLHEFSNRLWYCSRKGMQCSRKLMWRDALQFDEAGKWLAMTENGTWWLWETGVRLHVIRCKLKSDCKRLLRLGKAKENWNKQYSLLYSLFFFFCATELFGFAHDCHQNCNSECQPSRDRSSTWWYKHK